jgi:hypothetical protein
MERLKDKKVKKAGAYGSVFPRAAESAFIAH